MSENRKTSVGFRRQIVTAFIVVVLIIGILFSIFVYILSIRRSAVSYDIATRALNEFSKINFNLQSGSLEPLAKQYVVSKVKDISVFLSGEFRYHTEKEVLNDNALMKVITEYISFDGKQYGSLYLVDNAGTVILSPHKETEGKNVCDLCDYTVNSFDKTFGEIISKDINSGFLYVRDSKTGGTGNYFFASAKIKETRYILFGVIDLQKFLEPANYIFKEKEKHIRTNLDNSLRYEFQRDWHIIIILSLLVIFVLCIISSFVGMYLSKRLVKPISKLRNAIVKTSAGNFNIKVEESGTTETIELARAFNQLGGKLSTYIENLKDETALRESIESEIKIARTIQQSILPKLTGAFRRKEFSIVTELVPAKEVAGDFYDFFYLNNDPDKLVLVIGDVSGKGVPAAFFMGVLKATIRNFCQSNYKDSPGEILTKINKEISSENSEVMFASIFLIYYDVETGNVTYANAGHHNSILVRNDSSMHFFGKLEDSLLGIFEEDTFKTDYMQLLPGEAVFCYTDGLTDALSPDKKFYGIKNLCLNMQNKITLSPNEFATSVIGEVLVFQNNVIFDDITVLYFKRNL